MSDFPFNCPQCNQSFEAPEEMLGETISCPTCQAPIKITKFPPKPTERVRTKLAIVKPTPASQQETCTHCGEQIGAGAVICVGCGRNLKTGQPVQSDFNQPLPPYPQRQRTRGNGDTNVDSVKHKSAKAKLILIVVAIIGLLAGVVYIKINKIKTDNDTTACISNLREIKEAQLQAMLNFETDAPTAAQVKNSLKSTTLTCPSTHVPYDLSINPPVCPSVTTNPAHDIVIRVSSDAVLTPSDLPADCFFDKPGDVTMVTDGKHYKLTSDRLKDGSAVFATKQLAIDYIHNVHALINP